MLKACGRAACWCGAAGLPETDWIRLSAGAGSKGPRLFDWAYLPLATLPAEALEGIHFVGELSLSGEVKAVRGVLPLAIDARRESWFRRELKIRVR